MTTCRSCAAEVVFVPSATTGKSMILDAAPTKGVVIGHPAREGGFNLFPAVIEPSAQAHVVDVYTDHHVTCPDAAAWKGKRR